METAEVVAPSPTGTPSPPSAPTPAYEEIAPNMYRHVQTGEVVVAADILTFADTHPESELHSVFEWDDQRAAALWRLQQVRELLLNSLVIRPDGTADLRAATHER